MAFFSKRKLDPQAVLKDKFNEVVPQADTPIDHERLKRTEIKRNAAGLVVQLIRVYDDGSGGDDTFTKLITPTDSDTTPVTTQTINLWVRS